jgi:hypothetical protein
MVEQFFGSKMLLLRESCFENRQALIGHAQTFGGQVGFVFFAGRVVTHVGNVSTAEIAVKPRAPGALRVSCSTDQIFATKL